MTFVTRSPLICIGKNIHLEKSGYDISELYIAPGEQLLIVLDAVSFDDDLMWTEITTWDYDIINEICEEYTYATTGQAYRLIDLLVKYGCASFSTVNETIALCKDTIKSKVHVASRIIPGTASESSKNSVYQFIKRFCSAGRYKDDSLIEAVFSLSLLGGVSINVKKSNLEIRISVGDSASCPILTFSCVDADTSAFFIPAELHTALEANGLFPHDADEFLKQYAAYIDTSKSTSAFFWNPAQKYQMDVDKIATDWAALSGSIVKLIYAIS